MKKNKKSNSEEIYANIQARNKTELLENIRKTFEKYKKSIKINGTSKEDRLWIQEIFCDNNINIDVYSEEKKGQRILVFEQSNLD